MRKSKGFFLFLWMMFCSSAIQVAHAQQTAGCTDPAATNYNPTATQNDGSCVYPNTNYSPQLLFNLNDTLRETSGLAVHNNRWFTHNDSGNTNEIFEINPQNGQILRRITISNATNVDWEAMGINNQFLFMGDFGNNAGNRQNLKILKVDLTDLLNQQTTSLTAEIINFSYPDQLHFNTAMNNHNFDCEAMFYYQDSLHLFSKNWGNGFTKHYRLPISTGTYATTFVDSFFVDGLVTDASIDTISGNAVLLGYKAGTLGIYSSFATLLYDYPGTNFLSGNKRRIDLGSTLTLAQTEGIYLNEQFRGIISAEAINQSIINISAKIWQYDFATFYPSTVAVQTLASISGPDIEIMPNPFTQNFKVLVHQNSDQFWQDVQLMVFNMSGQSIYNQQLSSTQTSISTEPWPSGIYVIRIAHQFGIVYKKVVKT